MAKNSTPSEAMAGELRELMRHATALVEATAGEADEQVKKVRAQLEDRLEAARRKYAAFDDLVGEKVEAADRLIHEKPYHAVGGSFLLGLLLGWFMSRK